MLRPSTFIVLCLPLLGCGPASQSPSGPPGPGTSTSAAIESAAPQAMETRVLTIVGTNDLHGHIETTPLLGGYLNNLRRARKDDHGAMLLVDAGDMFQGTLESNMGEGMAVLHAYKALGYQAAAIGNHEFDYGPSGPAATPQKPGDDPRGALEALANAASFPFLNANVLDKTTHQRFALTHSPPSVLIDVSGIKVGIVGVTSSDTLETTISSNVRDLEIAPLAQSIEKEAKELREKGHADVVVAVTHSGGKCKSFTGDLIQDECETDSEIFKVARALPAGAVDAIVAGHTHQGVAHTVAGIPIIESFSYGRAFGRIDLTLTSAQPAENDRGVALTWHVAAAKVFPPQDLCEKPKASDIKQEPPACITHDYEGAKVEADPAVALAIAPDLDKAKVRRGDLLGVRLTELIHRNYDHESAEGNLFTDLLRKAHPGVDVVMMNGGGLRADLPPGPLSYGALYEAFPFDNKVGTTKITVADLEKLLIHHFTHSGGILSVSGIRVKATCEKGALSVTVERANGKKLKESDTLNLMASDFMMTGGDHFWGPVAPPHAAITNELMRDSLELELRTLKTVQESDSFDPKKPRLVYTGERPLHCEKP